MTECAVRRNERITGKTVRKIVKGLPKQYFKSLVSQNKIVNMHSNSSNWDVYVESYIDDETKVPVCRTFFWEEESADTMFEDITWDSVYDMYKDNEVTISVIDSL